MLMLVAILLLVGVGVLVILLAGCGDDYSCRNGSHRSDPTRLGSGRDVRDGW
jgi:hypothetical protein